MMSIATTSSCIQRQILSYYTRSVLATSHLEVVKKKNHYYRAIRYYSETNHHQQQQNDDPQMPWKALGTYWAVRLAGENTQSLRTFFKPDEFECVLEGFCDTMRQQQTTTIAENLQQWQQAANEIQQRIQNEMCIRIETQGNEYCQTFQQQQENVVQKTQSGLLYRIDHPGNGPNPTIHDLVEVHYHGIMVHDGTVIDSTLMGGSVVTTSSSSPTTQQPKTRIFPMAAVMDGWKEALGLLRVGGMGRFVLPPYLAYGMEKSQVVPPGATLQYDIELVRIIPASDSSTSKEPNISQQKKM